MNGLTRPFRVVLVNPPPFQVLEPEYDRPRFGRTGLAYLAGHLRQFEGFSVSIIDAKLERLGFAQTLKRILEKKPDLVGFGAFTCEIKPAAYLAKQIKAFCSDITTLIGGVHVTAIPEQTLKEFPRFDLGIYGEGEVTFYETCRALQEGGRLDEIAGLVFRREGEILTTLPRERIADQDTIPFPAWELLPRAEEYVMMTQRGCPFNCVFCMNPNGRTARPRSVENFMEELLLILNRYQPKEIRFGDELFSVNMDRTHRLLDAMIEAGVPERVQWHAQTHVHFVDLPLLKKMKRAGVRLLGMGIETGDVEMLRKTGKGTNSEMILRAVQEARKAGVPIMSYFILGHPNETVASIKKTIDSAAKLNPSIPAFGIMVPYPGTEVAKLAAEGKGGYRLRSTDWDDYDKQIGGALEFIHLSRTRLEMLQLCGYLKVFLWNGRFRDLLKFCWRYRIEGWALLQKIIFRRAAKFKPPPAAREADTEISPGLFSEEMVRSTTKWQEWQIRDAARIRAVRPEQSRVVFAENQTTKAEAG